MTLRAVDSALPEADSILLNKERMKEKKPIHSVVSLSVVGHFYKTI